MAFGAGQFVAVAISGVTTRVMTWDIMDFVAPPFLLHVCDDMIVGEALVAGRPFNPVRARQRKARPSGMRSSTV